MSTVPMQQRLAYGLAGLPLAFAALPLYVQWPAHAAQAWGLPLAGLGALLLGVRLADAVVDPALGRWVDRLHARSPRRVWALLGGAALLLAAGFAALVQPPAAWRGEPALLWLWAGLALAATSLGYSLGQISHQSWAVRLGGGNAAQARWVAAREGFALAGVLLASVWPAWAGWSSMPMLLVVLLGAAGLALRKVPLPVAHGAGPAAEGGSSPWRCPGFVRLLAVYALNGLASAWPATLVLWFMRDQLLAPPWAEGALLALYFAAAALSLPWWTRQVSRHGPVRAWAQGMGLAVLAFAGVGLLPQGQWLGFALVCAGTGVALGADLVAAPTLLARQAGAAQAAGAWWGWWTAAGKLNLALAAGLALPLLQWSGFVPGQRDAASLQVLLWSYALAPCAMKLCALALLWRWRLALASDNPPPRLRGPQPERPCLP